MSIRKLFNEIEIAEIYFPNIVWWYTLQYKIIQFLLKN